MGTNSNLTDYVIDVLCPALDGRCTRTRNRVPVQFAMYCPCCQRNGGSNRKLSLLIENGRPVVNCHRKPSCPVAEIQATLNAIAPGLFPQRRIRQPGPVDRDALIRLAASDLPATALRIGMLRLAGFSAAKARAELGLAKSTYYDALRELGQ